MDTSLYMFAGYAVFWLVPLYFIIRLTLRLQKIEENLSRLVKEQKD